MPSPVVVDASALVELLRRTPTSDRVDSLLRGRDLFAPAHVDAEVLSALGRLVRHREMPPKAAERALNVLRLIPVFRHPVEPLLLPAWDLRDNFSLRDALYVALARTLRCRLVTTDARLSRAPNVDVPISLA